MKLIKNFERDKYELEFDLEEYRALSAEAKDFVKRYFSWSRLSKVWVSKGKLEGVNMVNYGISKHLIPYLDVYEEAEKGVKLTEIEKVEKAEEKAEKDIEYWYQTTDGYEVDYFKHQPPSTWYRRSQSVRSFPTNYSAQYKDELERTINYTIKELGKKKEADLPDRAKDAILRYMKDFAEFQGRDLSNWEYAPSVIVTGPGGYPAGRINKRNQRQDVQFRKLTEANEKFNEVIEKIKRLKRGNAYKDNSIFYLTNRLEEAAADSRAADRRGDKETAKQYSDLADLYREKIAAAGGSQFTKAILKAENATHIRFGKMWYPIISINEKTVKVGNWGYAEGKFLLPYTRISQIKTEENFKPVKETLKDNLPFPVKKDNIVGYSGFRADYNLYQVEKLGTKFIKLKGYPHGVKPQNIVSFDFVLDQLHKQITERFRALADGSKEPEFIKRHVILDLIGGRIGSGLISRLEVYNAFMSRFGSDYVENQLDKHFPNWRESESYRKELGELLEGLENRAHSTTSGYLIGLPTDDVLERLKVNEIIIPRFKGFADQLVDSSKKVRLNLDDGQRVGPPFDFINMESVRWARKLIQDDIAKQKPKEESKKKDIDLVRVKALMLKLKLLQLQIKIKE